MRSLKSLGKKKTYNLEMESKFHNYILGSGIVSKNSHSFAYARTAFKQAYLLSNYPVEFIGSYLSFQKRSTPKEKRRFQQIVSEANNIGVHFEVPDINNANIKMEITKDSIMMGFENVKGLGETGCEKIIKFRPFTSVADLIMKVDNFRGLSISVIKSMIGIGCFDSIITTNRSIEIDNIDRYKKNLKRKVKQMPSFEKAGEIIEQNEIDEYLEKCFGISGKYFKWKLDKNTKYDSGNIITVEYEEKPKKEKRKSAKKSTKQVKMLDSAKTLTLNFNGETFKL